MMNVLGIDYGEKNIGLAFLPSDVRVPVPFGTIIRETDEQIIGALQEIIARERIGIVVVGVPFRADGSDSSQTQRTKKFITKLRLAFSCEVQTISESFTSAEAASRAHGAGASIHERSAMLILEDWYENNAKR